MFDSKLGRQIASGLCCVGLFTQAGIVAAAENVKPVATATQPSDGPSLKGPSLQGPALQNLSTQGSPSTQDLSSNKVGETRDVELHADGTLRGQLVTTESLPLVKAPVRLWQGGQLMAESKTDADGNFKIAGVAGGTYQLATPVTIQTVRVWKAGTAPPKANTALLVVADHETVLGNGGLLHPDEWRTVGWIVAAIGAGIVVHAVRQGSVRDQGSIGSGS